MEKYEFVLAARSYMQTMMSLNSHLHDSYKLWRRASGLKTPKNFEIDHFVVCLDDPRLDGVPRMDELMQQFCLQHIPSVSMLAYRNMLSYVRAHGDGVYVLPIEDAYAALETFWSAQKRLSDIENSIQELRWKLNDLV